MRFSFIISCSFFLTNISAQSGQIDGKLITKDTVKYFPALSLTLQKEDTLIKTVMVNTDGSFMIKKVPIGVYKIHVKQDGYHDFITDTITVSKKKTKYISISYSIPCPFFYEKMELPSCIGGHIDKIIPVVYGTPTDAMFKSSAKNQIHLGGILSGKGCPPLYYCTIHKREL